MEKTILKAERREGVGKELAKKLRQKDKIPAVVYGHGAKPVSLAVERHELTQLLRVGGSSNMIINLAVSGGSRGSDRTVMIKEIQHHPVSNEICHVDFQIISLTEKILVRVPLHEVGESPGVTKGGILDHVHHDIEVQCLPTDIPERIDVDVSTLDFGHAIHVKDLKLPEKVFCVMDSEEVVFTVKAPKEEKAPEPTEAVEAVEPEVIKKGKEEKAEEGAEAGKKEPATADTQAKSKKEPPKEAAAKGKKDGGSEGGAKS